MAHVVLRNLVKTYGAYTAVNDVSLTVGDGEFVALVGPRVAARRPRSISSRG